jgi:hypothetical protein
MSFAMMIGRPIASVVNRFFCRAPERVIFDPVSVADGAMEAAKPSVLSKGWRHVARDKLKHDSIDHKLLFLSPPFYAARSNSSRIVHCFLSIPATIAGVSPPSDSRFRHRLYHAKKMAGTAT